MTTELSPSQTRDGFWARLGERLIAAGFRPSRRANYCYLRLGVANTELVLTAPTGDGGVECKLSLVGARRASTLSPEEICEQFGRDREVIEIDARFGPLEWGSGKSATRVYLRRPANVADRGTLGGDDQVAVRRAERFTAVFQPRLLAITDAARGNGSPCQLQRSSVRHGTAPPKARAQRQPDTRIARELLEAGSASGPTDNDADELALDAWLVALVDTAPRRRKCSRRSRSGTRGSVPVDR